MTLALATAINHAPDTGGNEVKFYSDTRLTTAGGLFDHAIKVVGLGSKSAVAMAGSTTLPVWTAVECARTFIATANRLRQGAGQQPLSVWEEAGMMWTFLAPAYGHFSRGAEPHDCQVIVGGFLDNEKSCLIEFNLLPAHLHVALHVPPARERRCVVIGQPAFAPYLRQAHAEAKRFDDVLSVLWDVVKHQGTPAGGIGGGVAFAYCPSSAPEFIWPPIEIDGHVFLRGLPTQVPPGVQAMHVSYDPQLFADLEKRMEQGLHPEANVQKAEATTTSMGPGWLISPELLLSLERCDAEPAWLAQQDFYR